MEESVKQPPVEAEDDALSAAPTTQVEAGNTAQPSVTATPGPTPTTEPVASVSSAADTPEPPAPHHSLTQRVNIYALLLILLFVLSGAVIFGAYHASQKKGKPVSSLKTQTLSKSDLERLASSDTAIGANDEVLNIQSSAVFAGKVLVRQDLETAGNLQIGGTLGLKDITAAGAAQFGNLQVSRNASVAGNASVQGSLTASSLQVAGSGSFSGSVTAAQVTTGSLQLSGNLTLTHHLIAGGAVPGRSNGGALGSGGTSSVSGSDIGGSITISTGSGPAAGCFITVNFATRYNATPHVIVTPVGSTAGSLNWYINRTSTNFSVCTTNAAPGGTSFGFDYFVVN